MKKRIISFCLLAAICSATWSQGWDYIQSSGEYYYGVGTGKTKAEAEKAALADLVQMIAIHVSNDFDMQTDETNANGNIDHKTYVRNCISTYSSSTLTNVRKLQPEGQEPNITVKCCMLRSELAQIYEKRIEKARDMVGIADEALEKAKVDMALQYYYWAYSLIRSLQHPTEAKDAKGHSLVTTLPVKIRGILEDISVTYEKKEGDFVDLLFTYKGRPVSGLDFTYSDGRESCDGMAKDGRGMLEMAPGYETDFYHLDIEYEYKNLARGDDELEAVLNVVRKTVFPQSSISVKGGASKSTAMASANSRKVMQQQATQSMPVAVPSSSQTIDDDILYGQAMERVLAAIKSRNYAKAASCFTLEGLEVYNKLISYGTGRVVGNPEIVYYRSMGSQVVARGLQMSFSFPNGKRKKTFVEDVVFTFNPNHKICNVAFGLGDVAEADILHRDAPGWKNETKELIMEFLENYKTAYCLKRLDYIRDIFADDAMIIVGNIVKRNLVRQPEDRAISLKGQDIITYNRYDKDTYLRNLARTFKLNEFINIRFTKTDVQWLDKYKDEELYGIQIGQEYTSSRYADKGYLFLLVDMTDHDAPQIKVRTWQPNEVSMSKIYSAGDFYND